MDPQPWDKVPYLKRLTGKVASCLAMHRSWVWRFLGICLLAAVVGGPARLTTGLDYGTSPAANLQHAQVAAAVDRIPQPQAPTPRTCTVSGSTVNPTAAGACTITASQSGSGRYAAAREVEQSFQVASASSILPNALKFLLGAAVFAAAGVTAVVRRVRRRARRPLPPHPSLRAVPDPGSGASQASVA